MKITKKIFAFAIACILFVSAFSILNAEHAIAAGSARLEINTVQGSEGDTISVTVSLKQNPGICGLAYKVGFDKNVLKVKNATASDEAILSDLAEVLPNGDGFVGYAFASSKTNSKTGTLLTIDFEILEGAAVGDSTVRFYDYESSDFDGATVNVTAVNGSVTVICKHTNTTSSVTKEATCTEKGEKTSTCTKCGAIISREEIAALGHTYGGYTVTKEATCTEKGEKTGTCAKCGATQTEEISALGHTYGEYTVTKEATCTEKGEKTGICAKCGATQTEEISALGHTYGEYTVTKEATCTEKGEKTGTCAKCGATQTEEISALGHAYGEYTVTKEATETEAGELTAVCSVDGVTVTKSIPAVKKADFSIVNENGSVIEKFTENSEVTFSVAGQGMDNTSPVAGDVRFVPASWKVGADTAEWTAAPYEVRFMAGAKGNCDVTIVYNRQIFNGTEWKTDSKTYTYEVTVPVVEKAAEETPSDAPSVEGGNDVSAPATGDAAGISTLFLAALWGMSGITVIAAIKKRKEA